MPQAGSDEFFPHRSTIVEDRIKHIESFLAQFAGRGPAGAAAQQSAVNAGRGPVIVPSGNGGGSFTGQIPESQIIFDKYGGHAHDNIISRHVTVAGDVTGYNDATTVVKIEGTPIPAPVAGNDRQFIYYDNPSVSFKYGPATSGAPLIVPQVTKTGNYTVVAGDTGIWADATGGAITITLLTAVGNPGKVVVVKKLDNVNNVTIATTGGQTIDGVATAVLTLQFSSVTLVSDNTQWWIV